VDALRAYHFGSRYIVEVEIILPPQMTVRESHDIALQLQHKVGTPAQSAPGGQLGRLGGCLGRLGGCPGCLPCRLPGMFEWGVAPGSAAQLGLSSAAQLREHNSCTLC